jgi:hypothetical protein
LKLPLSTVLHLPEKFNDELENFLLVMRENAGRFTSVLLLSNTSLTTHQDVINYVTQIKSQLPDVRVGAGTDYNFTELNRNRFIAGELDFISYTIYPQVHGFDDKTLIENLEGQRYTATSAKAIFPDKDVHVSPISFRARFNPNATNENEKIQSPESQIDPRQRSDFGAVWTLGSIKQLIEGGASSITYFQVCGALGIVSAEGTPYPIYNALQKLLLMRTEKVHSSTSSHPLIVDGILFNDRNGLVWNYTAQSQKLELSGKEIELDPYGIKALTF